LARWLRDHGIDVHVLHSTSITVSREHRCQWRRQIVPNGGEIMYQSG
jgi:hypothetical protein